MLTLSKVKKLFLVSSLVLTFSVSQATAETCMLISPHCLFKTIIEASPSMPVYDFISVPAMIRHVPAAMSKEEQIKVKKELDANLRSTRSEQSPSLTKIPFTSAGYAGALSAANQEYMSLEPFPLRNKDSEEPLKIAKAIEVIFLRPGWKEKDAVFTPYDQDLIKYYHGQFVLNNSVEVLGFAAYMQNKVEEMLGTAEQIQRQIESAGDLNKSQRANYAARLMEYELMVIQNQIRAAKLQTDISGKLDGMILDAPIFSNM